MTLYEDGQQRLAAGLIRTPTGGADTSLYVALFSTVVNEEDSASAIGRAELSGSGYTRKAVTMSRSSEETTNTTAVVWNFTGSKSITWWALCVGASRGSADLLIGGSANESVSNGSTLTIAVGDLDVSYE